MDLLLVRHAEPIRIDPGLGTPADPHLTDRGGEQSARLAEWLGAEGVDHVAVSPKRRSIETATPLATTLGIDIEVLPDLREYDAEADEYIPVEQMRAAKDDRWFAMIEGRWEDYGGEPVASFRARVVPCLEALIDRFPGGRVAVISHGGVINVYLADLLGIELPIWFDPEYTSISRVAAARSGQRSVLTVNETAHLFARREAQ
ncbi:MAG: histidine phosphatase family protein [Acidimicrobiia bacterium]